MTRRGGAALLVAAVLSVSCGSDSASAPTLLTTTAGPPGTDVLREPSSSSAAPTSGHSEAALPPTVTVEQVECPSFLARDSGPALACGATTVPIDRSDASIGATEISIATLAGTDSAAPFPVAVLQGGPGGASTELGAWFAQRAFTQVFIDQRGTGFRGPDFDCPEIFDALGAILSAPSQEAAGLSDAAYDACARRLRDDPVLANTTTDDHAADVADVMTALGYDQWMTYGVSYGSTVALELLDDAPAGLVGVVLDGVYPPELDVDAGLVASADRSIEELDTRCAEVDVCRSFLADGSVERTLERTMASLAADPMTVVVAGADVGYPQAIDVVLDGPRVGEFAFLLLYQESLLRFLPAVLGRLEQRDAAAAQWLARTGARLLVAGQAANDEGTYFAVQCHDRAPFTDGPGTDLSPLAEATASVPLVEQCADWERRPGDPSVADRVDSSIPTLLLSGNFDPITPASYADDVARTLDHATVVEQVGRGHGIWAGSECIGAVVERFVFDPSVAPDTACVAQPVPVVWARP